MRLRIVAGESLGRGRRDRGLSSGKGAVRCVRPDTTDRTGVDLSELLVFFGTRHPSDMEEGSSTR